MNTQVRTQLSTFNFQLPTFKGENSTACSFNIPSLEVERWKLEVESCAALRGTNRRAGLTLIEVMLALVILGVGMVALVTAAGRCIGVARQAKNYESARELLARVEVEKPMMLEEEPEDIAGGGSFEPPFETFTWKREIEQEGFEDDGLWKVVTEISWTEHKSARRERVETLIYWPEDKEGGTVQSAP